jgi:branched-chain amino acid transport system substrate-binding protein
LSAKLGDKVIWVIIGLLIANVVLSGVSVYFMHLMITTPPQVITPAAPVTPIKIGILQDLSGPLAPYGRWGARAAVVAIDMINEMGGIAGRPVIYKIEDSATSAEIGVAKFRKLVEEWGADFVIGPCNSAVDMAVIPLAKQYKVIYFVFGTATSLTEEKGNRWIFRLAPNARMGCLGLGTAAAEMGKYFVGFGADYEWGHSVVEETSAAIMKKGGVILDKMFCPIGTVDYVPFLLKINPDKTDGVILGFFAGDASRVIKQADELGYTKKLKFYGMALQTCQKPEYYGSKTAQESILTYAIGPINLADFPPELRDYERAFREAMGIDERGIDKATGELASIDYCWVPYEEVWIIKDVIEACGWKSKADHPKFIQTLENMKFKASFKYPHGDFYFRAQDHQAFGNIPCILKIEGGWWKLVKILSVSDTYYETKADYTKEPL